MNIKFLKALLISMGLTLIPDVHAEDLVQAIYQGNIESVRSGLQSGADVDQLQSMGSQRASALHLAVRLNQPEIARLLIDEGADVDIRDGDDSTPLHIAAWHGNLEMIKLLVESGADIRATSSDGRTPLSCANGNNQHDAVSFIRSKLGVNF